MAGPGAIIGAYVPPAYPPSAPPARGTTTGVGAPTTDTASTDVAAPTQPGAPDAGSKYLDRVQGDIQSVRNNNVPSVQFGPDAQTSQSAGANAQTSQTAADKQADSKLLACTGGDGCSCAACGGDPTKDLEARDTEVRTHEAAHLAAAGEFAASGPILTSVTSKSGKSYATDGKVMVSTGAIANDPQKTIAKMKKVQAAALAPANPSGQDRAVAAQASVTQANAESELQAQSKPGANAPNGKPATTAGGPQVAQGNNAKTAGPIGAGSGSAQGAGSTPSGSVTTASGGVTTSASKAT